MKLKSFALGALTAATITLLTTKKSGQQRIDDCKKMITTTKNDVEDISLAIQETKNNLDKVTTLTKELIPTFTNSLNEEINKFTFQLNPRLERLNEHLENLNDHLNNQN